MEAEKSTYRLALIRCELWVVRLCLVLNLNCLLNKPILAQ